MRNVLLTGLVLVILGSSGRAADEFKLEEGFKLLFNGKDLSGWKLRKYSDKTSEEIGSKTEAAGKRFVVTESKIVVDPKVKGDMVIETAKSFDKDVHIKFDYLPAENCNNDLLVRGQKFDIKKGDVKNVKFGEWNTFEIVITGENIEFKNNGESIKKATLKGGGTPFGIRAELGAVEIKNIRAKE